MNKSSTLIYKKTVKYINDKIINGDYLQGDLIPGQRIIAKALSISRLTVSRAIKALEQEGILESKPSVGSFVKRIPREKTIVGYLVDNLQNPFHLEMIRELDCLLGGLNAAILVSENQSPKHLTEMGSSKIIRSLFIPSNVKEDVVHTVYLGYAKRTVNSVIADNKTGMRFIYQHLKELGHRRIGYVGVGTRKNDQRYNFLGEIMADNGQELDPAYVFFLHRCVDTQCASVIKSILKLKPKPTALVCDRDWLATKIMHQAKLLGLNIPEELSLTGFNDLFTSKLLQVPLTTVRLSINETAKKLIKILFESDLSEPVNELVDVELVVRDSTRKITVG